MPLRYLFFVFDKVKNDNLNFHILIDANLEFKTTGFKMAGDNLFELKFVSAHLLMVYN